MGTELTKNKNNLGAHLRKIVFLMLKRGQLYKSTQFSSYKYVGDPINSVKIFNDFKVDELVIVDTDCTLNNSSIKLELLKIVARTARMPICYGGGIRSVSQMQCLIGMGFDKVMLSHAAITNPTLIEEAADRFGRQALVGCLDVRFSQLKNTFEIYTHQGTKRQPLNLNEVVTLLQKAGIGEIVVNSIDRDGTFLGYDARIVNELKGRINVPFTILGGAKSSEEVMSATKTFQVNAAAGSAFTFYNKNKQVLLNYF